MGYFTFSIKAVHQRLHNVQFVFHREIDKVCVKQNVIGRTKLCVVLKKQR